MSGVEDFIENDLGGTVGDRDDVPVDCIACGKENHLYVNVRTGVAYCFKCGYSPSMTRLIMDLRGCDYKEAQVARLELDGALKLRMRDTSLSFNSLSAALREMLSGRMELATSPPTLQSRLSFPSCCVSITHPFAARGMAYLKSRGFTKKRCHHYGLMYVHSSSDEIKWRNHIIFPVRNYHGDLVYFSSRFAGTPERGPKSNTPKGVSKRESLFGLAQLKPQHRDDAIVVEGPLDAMALWPCGVALFGKTATNEQVIRLSEYFNRVVVVLDHDAFRESVALCERLQSLGVVVSQFFYKRGDAADRVRQKRQAEFLLARPNGISQKNAMRAQMIKGR